MAEAALLRRWRYRLLYLFLCALFIFWRLLPVTAGPDLMSSGDFMLAITLAWLLRRPEYVPVWLIAPIFLLADMLLMRPPGLLTCVVVIATEYLRGRQAQTRNIPPLAEFVLVSITIVAICLVDWVGHMIAFSEHPTLVQLLTEALVTTICYGAAVVLTVFVFGIRRDPVRDTGIGGFRV